jgi:hypothetical protein
MAAKRILLLDGPFLTAHRCSGGHVTPEGEFSHEPVGLEALAAYLKKYRSSLFYLLADTAEEGFQLEDLPYVQGADRSAMLQRRLSQYFYNTPLSAAISLGRAPDGRRDEKLLFAAFTRIETFAPWLDALREAETILAGVYSVPLVLAGCVPQLLGNSGPLLFVSLSRGGLRQTFFERGKLHFSRLSQLATRSIDEIGRTTAAESAKIFQYLVAQRQIPRGVTLRTIVLAHAQQIPALQEFCNNTEELQFEFVELAATMHRQGLKDVPLDSSADGLLCHCLATKTPSQQFAPDSERRFYNLWQIRFALTGAAWILLTAALMFAGKTALNVYELRESMEVTKTVTATDTQRYNKILEGLPKVNITPDNLRALVARFETLQRRAPEMEPLLVHLSQALNETPKIELTSLAWKVSDRLDVGPKAADDTRRETGAPPPVANSTAGNWAVLEIQAQLPVGLATDQRAQLEVIDSFAARLRTPQTEIRVLSRPFDIESDKPLKSAGEKDLAQLANAPKFSMRIARQL